MQEDICSPRSWIRAWEEATARIPNTGSKGYTSSRVWDRMAVDYDRWSERSDEKNEEAGELVAALTDRGLFREGMRVLDVGCGTGRLAIALAKHGAEVHALDFSPGMLGRMREALPAEQAPRVLPVEADWEGVDLAAYGWERAFDLVLACMTPAIRTPEAFLKLHDASRGGCYFRGWAGRRTDPLLEDLRNHLTGAPSPSLAGMAGSVLVAFNLLYAMGCSPSVEFQEVSWERREPVDKATHFYTEYFDGLGDLRRQELVRRISEYLATIAVDGRVLRRTEGRTGSIAWSKPEP